MNETLFELLEKVTLLDFFGAVCVMSAVGMILFTQKDRINKYLNKWRKTENKKEEFQKLVYTMQDTIKTIQENRIHDREDSRRIRDEMYESINSQGKNIKEISMAVDKIQETIDDMNKKNSETKRAEIKEKIARIYAECHTTMTCTDIQFETLEDLIKRYEAHGGENSFVHTLVLPEMFTWRRI